MKPRLSKKFYFTRGLSGMAAVIPLTAIAALLSTPAWADKIITRNGQTIEGIIKDENDFNINIDVRGVIIPVPRVRIKEVRKASLDDNVRSAIDRASEALSRNDVGAARTLVNQARTLNSQDPALLDSINRLDREISDLEQHGGTAEERRMRATELLRRANDAYDRIINDEGNQFLIQALKTDPTYEAAHARVENLLQRVPPDQMLGAVYFTQVLYPDFLRAESPVIPMLPGIYARLVNLFASSTRTQQTLNGLPVDTVGMLRVLSEAFKAHPSYMEGASEDLRAELEKPLEELLVEKTNENLAGGNFESALQKLQEWTPPDTSPEILKLYVRGEIGANRYENALALLDQHMEKFADDPDLRPLYNALKIMIEGDQAQKSNDRATAVARFETIFASRANLPPEIGEVVGRRLALLEAPEMETALRGQPGWRAADIAALVMRYGQDYATKRRAADLMIEALRFVTWRLDLTWSIQGRKIALTEDVPRLAMNSLSQPLAVRFDQQGQSPFLIRVNIDSTISGNPDQVVQALNSGQTLAAPVGVTALNISIQAEHSTLGNLFRDGWASNEIPQVTPTPGPEGAAPPPPGLETAPAPPVILPGMPLPPGAVPPGGPAAAPTPGGDVLPAPGAGAAAAQLGSLGVALGQGNMDALKDAFADPATTSQTLTTLKDSMSQMGNVTKIEPPQIAANKATLVMQFEKGPGTLNIEMNEQGKITTMTFQQGAPVSTPPPGSVLVLQSPDSIKQFLARDLIHFIHLGKVSYLPSRLNIPIMREILSEQAAF